MIGFLTKVDEQEKQDQWTTKPRLTQQYLHHFFNTFTQDLYPWKYLKITAPKPSWSTLETTFQRNQEMMRFDDVVMMFKMKCTKYKQKGLMIFNPWSRYKWKPWWNRCFGLLIHVHKRWNKRKKWIIKLGDKNYVNVFSGIVVGKIS